MTIGLTGCGSKTEGSSASNLEGSCTDILEKVYANADLDQDLREAMEYYQNAAVDPGSQEYILGTSEIDFTDSVNSAPMISSVAYQCVLLRVGENQDVEAAKKLLTDHADPGKWICVEAESVVVENVGDVILFIMADQSTTDAVKSAFLALGES